MGRARLRGRGRREREWVWFLLAAGEKPSRKERWKVETRGGHGERSGEVEGFSIKV